MCFANKYIKCKFLCFSLYLDFCIIIVSVVYLIKCVFETILLNTRTKFIKIDLKGKSVFKKEDYDLIVKFVREFLRCNGIFLLKMMKTKAGDVVTATIVEQLFNIYKNKYRYVDFSNYKTDDSEKKFDLRLKSDEQN